MERDRAGFDVVKACRRGLAACLALFFVLGALQAGAPLSSLLRVTISGAPELALAAPEAQPATRTAELRAASPASGPRSPDATPALPAEAGGAASAGRFAFAPPGHLRAAKRPPAGSANARAPPLPLSKTARLHARPSGEAA
ncbi:hypothetical protein [Lutibaculum baratangense]|uniref:Uncharacterized protein n=1 Tax=Lutibaculum baratangense AMV1 TaxID=631454 RepID=V4TCP1_9HYPH|nr:hypothetical protein [Lutibaculum baratangense]ESR24068.1 hypothetical protein N177_2517 [Lutibaculum baratangense AMV1]